NDLLEDFDKFMNDDFSTARVLANMFEIVPTINSIKDKILNMRSISSGTLQRMQTLFYNYLEEVFGLKDYTENNETFSGVMELVADIRKEAKQKKDFATSDKIRNHVAALGINMKDEKDGSITWQRR
ncbi:MAG: DALR domain-containing protein, partial [Ginsengibacter sp.]